MKKFFLVLSTFVLMSLAVLLGWLVSYTEALSAAGDVLEWTQFLGRFHPVVLHLPIGLFLGLFVIEVFALRRKSAGLDCSAHILTWLMALTSVLTAYLGLLLASSGDYSGETLWRHKWLGIIFAAAALLVAFLKVLSVCCTRKGTSLYRWLILGLLLLLPVVGHYGGELTHGAGYLTQYVPDWLKDILEDVEASVDADKETIEGLEEGNLYTHQIQPILDQYCVSCHGMEKHKSKYRVDSYEYLMTPGKISDTPIEPYSISESFLLEYMWLPESDDMAMPPEGKPRPSAEEILAITHWVAMGAKGPPVDEAALAVEQAAVAVEQTQWEALFEFGILLQPVAKGSNLLYLDFQNAAEELSDETLGLLAPYKDRIDEIKLTGRDNASKPLDLLRGGAVLRTLNLNELRNADAAIDVLKSFAQLETLHLFGSDLSGVGLDQLSLPSLQRLYLGATNVSHEQIAAYRQNHPSVKVYGDVDLSAVEAIKLTKLENTSGFNPNEK